MDIDQSILGYCCCEEKTKIQALGQQSPSAQAEAEPHLSFLRTLVLSQTPSHAQTGQQKGPLGGTQRWTLSSHQITREEEPHAHGSVTIGKPKRSWSRLGPLCQGLPRCIPQRVFSLFFSMTLFRGSNNMLLYQLVK